MKPRRIFSFLCAIRFGLWLGFGLATTPVFAAQLSADALAIAVNANAVCVEHPQQNYGLCATVSRSANGPFDDVLFCQRRGELCNTLWSSTPNSVSVFVSLGFLNKGNYIWIAWADEGHPYYEIYDSNSLLMLKPGPSLSIIADDRLIQIRGVMPDGRVLVEVDADSWPKPACLGQTDIEFMLPENSCHFLLGAGSAELEISDTPNSRD